MARTVRTAGDYLRAIEHRLGSQDLELDHLVSINMALTELEGAHRWMFLADLGMSVTPISGQPYVTLPEDVREVVDIRREDGWGYDTFETSLEEINRLRALNARVDFATEHHVREVFNEGTRKYEQRVELFPTPTNGGDVLLVVYRKQIPRVSSDSDDVRVPDWLDLLVEEMCCAVAWGREEPELGSVGQRVAAVKRSDSMYDAKTRDGQLHPQRTPLQNGAVRRALAQQMALGNVWTFPLRDGGTS